MKTNTLKVGDAVVYKTQDNDSVSALVIAVGKGGVMVEWMTGRNKSCVVMVNDLSRLTPFGKSLFLAI
ncbi:MAG: hypothetical protein HOO67_01560 [Candidatus Peribacteraceae bacterium]|nr:hypothetical protein [Candidatus Peribacteraceae bacterium]